MNMLAGLTVIILPMLQFQMLLMEATTGDIQSVHRDWNFDLHLVRVCEQSRCERFQCRRGSVQGYSFWTES